MCAGGFASATGSRGGGELVTPASYQHGHVPQFRWRGWVLRYPLVENRSGRSPALTEPFALPPEVAVGTVPAGNRGSDALDESVAACHVLGPRERLGVWPWRVACPDGQRSPTLQPGHATSASLRGSAILPPEHRHARDLPVLAAAETRAVRRGHGVSDRLLDAHEAADLLNVPVSWVRESTRSGTRTAQVLATATARTTKGPGYRAFPVAGAGFEPATSGL